MKRFLFLSLAYVLLAGSSCPGPEPFDCTAAPEALAAARDGARMAPYYKVDEPSGRYLVTLRPGWSSAAESAA